MPKCPKCGSDNSIGGNLSDPYEEAVVFPGRRRFVPALKHKWYRFEGGVTVAPAFCCRECGLVWSSTSPDKLNKYIEKKCYPGIPSGGCALAVLVLLLACWVVLA